MKKLIINFQDILEDAKYCNFAFDYPVIKSEAWKNIKKKIRIFKVKSRKKIGIIKQNLLVFLGVNDYQTFDYLQVKLKGFILGSFLIGKLTSN